MAAAAAPRGPAAGASRDGAAPARPSAVLLSLILVAAVANLNLAVANVALPVIGDAFDASQTWLDLISVGYSLGLAASVLYLGAVGDRYGRKMMLMLGVVGSVPACLLAAYAPSMAVLVLARILGGVAAGMAYPTTLALITVLWSGPGRTRAIALWSGAGAACAALGPLIAGALLQAFWWGSVFLVTLPVALVALLMAGRLVPGHVNETSDPVDNPGGVLSVVMIAAVVLAINFAPVPGGGLAALVLAAIAVSAGVAFGARQRRAAAPLYDPRVAGRRIFWVAAAAGIIVFGALMGAMFVGQKSFAGARAVAQRYPHYASKITAAAKSAFLAGDKWAYAAGIGAVLLGAAVVACFFPKKEQEEALLARYHAQDAAGRAAGRTGSRPGKS
jgi:MFS transporter, DHA2 family, multidrug resistance protein